MITTSPTSCLLLCRAMPDYHIALRDFKLGQSYATIIHALCNLSVSQAVTVQLPAPRPLQGPALDEACAAAARHLPVAVHTYFETRPKVDAAVDLATQDTMVVRALQSAFTALDTVSKVSTEAAEQQAAGQPAAAQQGGGSKVPPAAIASSAKLESSMRLTEEYESGTMDGKRDPLAAPQVTMLRCGEVVQAAESLSILANTCQAAAQSLHPDLGQKLENVARPAKAAVNAAKRCQIAVSRALAEAVKQVGPPAFASGVLASVQAKLAKEESDQAKALKWTQQAADTFETKVKPDMEAALAATEPPPPKPKSEGEESEAVDHMAEAAEQQKLAEKMKQQRLEQQEKERAIHAFVATVAVSVSDAACDAGDKLDLSSYMAPNDDEVKETYVSAEDLIAAAEYVAADGVATQDESLQPATQAALEVVDETLVKLCRAHRAMVVANEVLRLAGAHPDVKQIESGLDDVLKSCTNLPKMQGALLDKLTAACDESVEDNANFINDEHRLQLQKLVAYEQVRSDISAHRAAAACCRQKSARVQEVNVLAPPEH